MNILNKIYSNNANNATSKSFVETASLVKIITNEEEFIGLKDNWNSLWKRSNSASFSQTYSFCYHSWKEILKDKNASLFCLTVFVDNAIVSIWPLVIYRRGLIKIIRPLGPSSAESSNILCDENYSYNINASLFLNIVMTESKCDILNLPFVKTNSYLGAVIPEKYEGDVDISPFADLQDETDWKKFCIKVGTNSRQQLNRKRNRLSEMGNLTFEIIDPIKEKEKSNNLIDWMMFQKQKWSEKTNKKGYWIFSDSYKVFLEKLISDQHADQSYKIFALMLDNQPIAVKIAFFGKTHIDLIIAGYHADAKYSKYSPGFVLDEFWIKEIFAQKLNIDFGAGNEPYKLFWSRNNKHDTISYQIGLTIVGRLSVYLWKQKRRLKKE